MSKTSKKYFDEKFKNRIWSDFLLKIKQIKTRNDIENILRDILTKNELILIEKRLAVQQLFKEGFSYREISEQVDMTKRTISFIKHGFERPPETKRVYSINKNYNSKTKKHKDFIPLNRPYRFIPRRRKLI